MTAYAQAGQLSGEDARERLRAARERVEAELTMPCTKTRHRWIAGSTQRPATDPKVWLLHVRYAHRRDRRTRDRLFELYRPYALSIAKRHRAAGTPVEDLVQVSSEALLHALTRFDPQRRTPFLAFAKPTIAGSVRRYLRDSSSMIRVPRRAHELSAPHHAVVEELTQEHGRAPSRDEVAERLGVGHREVDQVARATQVRRTVAIDLTSSSGITVDGAILGSLDPDLARTATRVALQNGIAQLDEDDRWLLHQYFVAERPQRDIAAELGCSQMQVSRLLRRALHRLRPHVSETIDS